MPPLRERLLDNGVWSCSTVVKGEVVEVVLILLLNVPYEVRAYRLFLLGREI